MLPGPYRIPAYRAVGHFRLTNKTPAATYRAPGRYEGTFVRERLMDAVADRLGLDRLTVRRRNLIAAAEMPFSRPLNALGTEVVYDSGDYALLLDKALAQIGWKPLQSELRRRRAAGELVGGGIAVFVEKGGLGPMDGTRITVDATGAVEQHGRIRHAGDDRSRGGRRLFDVWWNDRGEKRRTHTQSTDRSGLATHPLGSRRLFSR